MMGTTPGVKNDDGKSQLLLLLLSYFPRALRSVCGVSTFGASKYCPFGWESVDHARMRYSEALVRHLFAESEGEEVDSDSGLHHDAHVAWNALARLELRLREKEDGIERGTSEVLRDYADEIVESRGRANIPSPSNLQTGSSVVGFAWSDPLRPNFNRRNGDDSPSPQSHKEIEEYSGA